MKKTPLSYRFQYAMDAVRREKNRRCQMIRLYGDYDGIRHILTESFSTEVIHASSFRDHKMYDEPIIPIPGTTLELPESCVERYYEIRREKEKGRDQSQEI